MIRRGSSTLVAVIAGLVGALLLGGSPLAHASHVLAMSPDSGPPGSTVWISGQSQYASQPCTVRFAGNTVPVRDGTCATDGNGGVDERFTVPSVARDATYRVEFWAGDGEFAVLEDEFYFYVPSPPATSVSPTQGPPGTTVRVTGSDFASQCAIHFDQDQQVGPTECDVTGNGTIDETFRIPSSAAVGDHSVRACSRCGRSGEEWARAGFHVTEPTVSEEPSVSDQPTSEEPTSEPPVASDEPVTPPPTITSDTDPNEQPTRPERPPLNRGPHAFDDSATTEAGTAVRIDVVANDHDPEGRLNLRSVRLTSRPRHGTAHTDRHIVVYEPDVGFVGDDSLTYRVCDEGGACDSASITVTVIDPTDSPTDERTTSAEPGDCPPFSIRDLTVDPATGSIGTPVRISVTVDAEDECLSGRLRLTLNGQPLGDPLDLEGDGASFDWLVPDGLAPGSHVITVEDEAGERSLAEAPFELLPATSRRGWQSPLLATTATGALLLGGASVTAVTRRRRRLASDPCARPRNRVDELETNVADIRRDTVASRERAEEASGESQRLDGTLTDCREKNGSTGSSADLPDELAGLDGRYLLLEHLQPPLREEPISGILIRTLSTAQGATAREVVNRLESLPRPLAHVVVGPDGVVPLLPDDRVVPSVQAVTNPDAASGGSDTEAPEEIRQDVPQALQALDRAELTDLTPVGAGIEQGTLSVAIVGWENDSEANDVLRRAAAWCRERIRLHAIPVRHVDHAVGAARYEGLLGEWEVAGSDIQSPVEFPWEELLDLIESADDARLWAPLPTDPCEDLQQEADETRGHAAQVEEEAKRAEQELRDAEQELDQARRELADCECQHPPPADELVEGAEPPDDSDGS